MNWSLKNIPVGLRWVGSIAGALLLTIIGEKIYDRYFREDNLSVIIQQSIEESKRLELCVIPDSELSRPEIQRMRTLQIQIKNHFAFIERLSLDDYNLKKGNVFEQLNYLMEYGTKVQSYTQNAIRIEEEFLSIFETLPAIFSDEKYVEQLAVSSGITPNSLSEIVALSATVNIEKEKCLEKQRFYLEQYRKTKRQEYVKKAISIVNDTNRTEAFIELMDKYRNLFMLEFDFLNTVQTELVFANNDRDRR